MPNQSAAAGPDRRPEGDLFSSPSRTRQKKARYVCTRDQEDKEYAQLENDECGLDSPDDQVLPGVGPDSPLTLGGVELGPKTVRQEVDDVILSLNVFFVGEIPAKRRADAENSKVRSRGQEALKAFRLVRSCQVCAPRKRRRQVLENIPSSTKPGTDTDARKFVLR